MCRAIRTSGDVLWCGRYGRRRRRRQRRRPWRRRLPTSCAACAFDKPPAAEALMATPTGGQRDATARHLWRLYVARRRRCRRQPIDEGNLDRITFYFTLDAAAAVVTNIPVVYTRRHDFPPSPPIPYTSFPYTSVPCTSARIPSPKKKKLNIADRIR